ncbi:MAG: ComEC/Rec2 family competence protein [Lentisphaeria bacterium]|nr:ComEC/Rec2 family competence protein [Lentisphaeria bacterium]
MSLLLQCRKTLETLSSEWSFCAGTVLGAAFPAALPVGLLLPFRRAVWFFAGAVCVLVSIALSRFAPPPEFRELLGERPANILYKVELTDPRLSAVPGIGVPAGVRCRLLELKFPGEKEWRSCRGEVLFYSRLPVPRACGTVLSGQGICRPPEHGSLWRLDGGLYRNEGTRFSLLALFQKGRDLLLARLCSGIRSDDCRQLAAAFFFGATGGMTPERRGPFTAAGTVHLFAVSGLHVGMVSVLLLLLLRFLPFRSRYFATAALTWVYVLLTGAAVPALRAGVMMTLFLLARGMLFKVSIRHLLGAAAGIAVVMDPASLSSPGFQYSFFITASLLLLGEKLVKLRELEAREFALMPRCPESTRKHRAFDRKFALFALAASGITAIAAGSVVSLGHDLPLAPGAVAANFLTLPVLGTLFALLPVKLLLSFGPVWLDHGCADLISGFFAYLLAVSRVTAELAAPFYAAPPAPWLSLVMAALLLTALGVKNARIAAISGVLFGVLLFSFPLRSFRASSLVALISSDSQLPPTVVITGRTAGASSVINPVYPHLDETERLLRRSGVSRIGAVGFSEPSVKNLSGLGPLSRRFAVEKLLLPPAARSSWQFWGRVSETPGDFVCVPPGMGAEKFQIFRKNSGFAIDYPDSGVMLSWKLDIRSTDSGRQVVFERKGRAPVRALLPWSNKSGVWQHEL